MMTSGIVTPSPMIGSSSQMRGVREVFYKYHHHGLSRTKLTTDGEDLINLVKQLGQAVCFSLADILTVNVRFDSRAARQVQQPRTVGQSEGGLHAGVQHRELSGVSLRQRDYN